jgi:predicted O-linked N-acetylglucosamine transferase (SPINDLY family)
MSHSYLIDQDPTAEITANVHMEPRKGLNQIDSEILNVGFIGAFFFHHSVGLLIEGVISKLDR